MAATGTIERKTLRAIETKETDKGEVEACVATMGVVDNDGDFMRPGCIESGSKVIMSDYGHSSIIDGSPPVGKGVITVVGAKALFRGQLFMDTAAGQQAFKTLKAMGPDQEWSFGYKVITQSVPTAEEKAAGAYRSLDKLKSFEVSPVFMGAGLGTGTTFVKSEGDRPELDAIARGAAAEFDRLRDRAATMSKPVPRGRPLSLKYGPLVEFCMRKFSIPSTLRPSFEVVSKIHSHRPDYRVEGEYDRESNTIRILDGMSDARTEQTIIHEFAHAYESKVGWMTDEGFARTMERIYHREWTHENLERRVRAEMSRAQ